MTDGKRDQLKQLLIQQTDGKLDAESIARLGVLLRDDREAQQFYVEHCQMHAMLAWEHGVMPALFEESRSESADRTRPRKFQLRNLLAIAASVMLVFGVGWLMDLLPYERAQIARLPSDWESRPVVARVSKSHGARLSPGKGPVNLQPGDAVRTGEYRVAEGFVQLGFLKGAAIIIESPASFRIDGELSVALHEGRLSARVSDDARGFTIETPSAEVVDFGTEFAVEVASDQSSEVHVFEGEVEVRPKLPETRTQQEHRAVRLVANQATRFNSSGSAPLGIDLDSDRFVRDLSEPTQRHHRAVRDLDPVRFYRMASSIDGHSLKNRVGRGAAEIVRGEMLRPTYAPGRIGSSLRLDGPDTRSYAVMHDYPVATDNKLSVCAWVYAESRPSWASIAKNGDRETIGQFHFGLFDDDGDLEVHVRDGTGKEVQVREHTPLPLSVWNHVAFVVDGITLSLYRNGELIGTTPCDGLNKVATRWLGIGAKINHDGSAPSAVAAGFWHGRIDELAIFHRGLSIQQIKTLYESASGKDPENKSQSRLTSPVPTRP